MNKTQSSPPKYFHLIAAFAILAAIGMGWYAFSNNSSSSTDGDVAKSAKVVETSVADESSSSAGSEAVKEDATTARHTPPTRRFQPSPETKKDEIESEPTIPVSIEESPLREPPVRRRNLQATNSHTNDNTVIDDVADESKDSVEENIESSDDDESKSEPSSITISNPTAYPVSFLVDDEVRELEPGETVEVAADSDSLRYHRGGSFGEDELSLTGSREFVFDVSRADGWQVSASSN